MTGCTICGEPADAPETHHHNQQKGDNDPDNLRPVHRRCHMHLHENDRATDDRSTERYGPDRPTGGPRSPATGPSGPP